MFWFGRLEDNPFPFRITQAVRDQYRFMGPELPVQYHPMLRDVIFGTAAEKKNTAEAAVASEFTANLSDPIDSPQAMRSIREHFDDRACSRAADLTS